MQAELKGLQIDRTKGKEPGPSKWAMRWIIGGVLIFVLLGAARFVYGRLNAATEVQIARVHAESAAAAGPGVVLNATGYIVAAHRIEVASKVIGRVAWIGVEKGDKVKAGQVLVRLEDDEYRAQLEQAKGALANLQARLAELEHGSRPEEIAVARANLEQAKADQVNARVTLDRTRNLAAQGVLAKQALDDAQAKYDSALARANSLQKTLDLAVLGPRQEEVDAMRGQVEQAKGAVAYATTQLDNTVIRAPVTGTVLERAVEKGEFLTTMFVGDKGAKGYVVALADLNDLQVELDISQNDFAKLRPRQKGVVTTDAFPDRKYDGIIWEMSPEANRQKATVQIKVKVLNPDDYLRPEMNASVAFLSDDKAAAAGTPSKPVIVIPSSAIRNNAVFVMFDGKAVRRAVKTGPANSKGVRIEDGLIGGEDLILSPPESLKDGDHVKPKQS
ncbi:MAG TPA: efflux RND transporter periplasmic adaptor subunit [Bryobacteraceae bacterium]|nr:efflux RND transporter periplasmic adaptor subunit [Bryobacteraceae bacterium]